MFLGGAAAAAVSIASQPELRWYAFTTNFFCMIISLMAGMYAEARILGYRDSDSSSPWQKNIERYVDYSKYQILAVLPLSSAEEEKRLQSIRFSVIAVGTANIPLLFQIYLGGSGNAIFLVVPVLTGTFAYINIKNFGPGLLRLLLLKKIEKIHGRRFNNADLEQIQELRRTFFLSRWLMKDYFKPASNATAENSVTRRK